MSALQVMMEFGAKEESPMADPVNVNRWFWKCRDCLSVVAVNEDVKASQYNLPALKCGCCGGSMWPMGKVYQDKLVQDGVVCACDFRCTCATGPVCNCKCGGKNHGTGKVVHVRRVVGDVPVAVVPDSAKQKAIAEEYRSAVDKVAAELEGLNSIPGWLPREKFDRKRKLSYVLRHAAGLTSHSARMKCLKSA